AVASAPPARNPIIVSSLPSLMIGLPKEWRRALPPALGLRAERDTVLVAVVDPGGLTRRRTRVLAENAVALCRVVPRGVRQEKPDLRSREVRASGSRRRVHDERGRNLDQCPRVLVRTALRGERLVPGLDREADQVAEVVDGSGTDGQLVRGVIRLCVVGRVVAVVPV